MKFTDGHWLLREGVTAAYPIRRAEVDVTDQRLRVLAPTFPVRHRGDLLKGPVLTVDLASPMTDVIGVTLTHFAGEQPRRPAVRPRHRRARGRRAGRRRGGHAHQRAAVRARASRTGLAAGVPRRRAAAHHQRREGHGAS